MNEIITLGLQFFRSRVVKLISKFNILAFNLFWMWSISWLLHADLPREPVRPLMFCCMCLGMMLDLRHLSRNCFQFSVIAILVMMFAHDFKVVLAAAPNCACIFSKNPISNVSGREVIPDDYLLEAKIKFETYGYAAGFGR